MSNRVKVSDFEKTMIKKLEALEEGLSEWEQDFLENIKDLEDISTKQESILHEIYDRKFL